MKTLTAISDKLTKKFQQRGSALLVSLMVLVGLSLLGLGFVALSETETAISTNERNYSQVQRVAEAGGLMVVEWFQNPDWAVAQGLMPTNQDAIKCDRFVTALNTNIGKYKPNTATTKLCDKPFKPNTDDKFYGTEDQPDILINDKTLPAFMTNFNIKLFNNNPSPASIGNECTGCDNTEGGRITEIRIYAPPTDGATTNTAMGWSTPATSGIPATPSGFLWGGTRFGVATIRVTAAKFNKPDCGPYKAGCQIVAQRTSKFVVSEWPFPGPQGPIQSNANIATTGDFKVHWGKITATGTTFLKRPYVSLPWHNAWDKILIEQGYEAGPDGVNHSTVWPTTPASADYRLKYNWMYEILERSFEDPWYQARARGTVGQLPNTTDPDPNRYQNQLYGNPGLPLCNPCNSGDADTVAQSNIFQLQTKNEQPDYTDALFPKIDYNFWKQIAISADDQDNVYYLTYDAAASGGGKVFYRDRGGNSKDWETWVNVVNGAKPGFYFFDTANKLNPQNNGGGTLTPKIDISGGGPGSFLMQGFIYLNSSEFSPAGMTGPAKYYNMPGEYYRDIGYRKVNLTTRQWEDDTDPVTPPCVAATGQGCVVEKGANNTWDWQDLPWSNGAAATNGKFDYFVAQRASLTRESGTVLTNEWFVVPWYPGCNPGTNGGAGSPNCSEPHEPYLNFVYPSEAAWSTNSPPSILVRTSNPASAADRRRKTTANTPPTALEPCDLTSTEDECTSNRYDRDGGLVELTPILDGVFYNEGTFTPTGNPHFFGSLLFEQSVSGAGTPDIWFDEKLIKGSWPPGYFGFPRVYITTHETDQ